MRATIITHYILIFIYTKHVKLIIDIANIYLLIVNITHRYESIIYCYILRQKRFDIVIKRHVTY